MTRSTLPLSLMVIFLFACGGEDLPGDRGTYQRGTGKADGTHSCVGFCGDRAPAGCYCDATCSQFGDCCPDVAPVCEGQTPGSCKDACGEQSPKGCYCDEECEGYGDCCADKKDECDDPPVARQCSTDLHCDDGQYCKLKGGECLLLTLDQHEGVCADKSGLCTMEYAPVCGCDSRTYPNACAAAALGVNVASSGACTRPPEAKKCLLSLECAADEFCNYEKGKCWAPTMDILEGRCTKVPSSESCLAELAPIALPVCGCNHKTYASECLANADRVSVGRMGACAEPRPPVCGENADCEADEFCRFEDEACTSNDPTTLRGVCIERPGPSCGSALLPVCGCDGMTYGSRCEANAIGQSIASDGPCPS